MNTEKGSIVASARLPDGSSRERFTRLLDEQGHIPSADPDIAVVYELLDEHYAHVRDDLHTAGEQASARIMSDLGSWRRNSVPAGATKYLQLVGWVDPQIIVRDGSLDFPTHHTPESMADYAADHVDDLDEHEASSLGLHVSIHSHWNGHVAEVTTNGRHRAAIYRASGLPLVQCHIQVPRNGVRQFTPQIWTEREHRLMGWLLDQGLITRFTDMIDPREGASYTVPHGSPIPWLLPDYRRADLIDALPKRIAALESDFGPISDDRLDPLRTSHGIRGICGPRSATMRSFARMFVTPPPPMQQDPAQDIGDAGQPTYEIPTNVLSSLLEGLPAHTAAFLARDSDLLVPGDPFGRVIAWLWINDRPQDVVYQFEALYEILRETRNPPPSWERLIRGLPLSLPGRGITSDQVADLIGELRANSPEARVSSKRPEPEGARAHRLAQRDEERGLA